MTKEYKSPNYDKRPDGTIIDTIILHYTGMQTGQDALEFMCNREAKVSAHYCIEEDGKTHELVPCEMRAWHAGKSLWRGKDCINNNSIGIEIVNPGHEFGYTDFPKKQMDTAVFLCKKLINTFPIEARNIIAHSDIAPDRKQDPGELFDWKMLAQNGIGLWPDINTSETSELLNINDRNDRVRKLQTDLVRYGYGLITDGVFEEKTELVVKAFQRHFGNTTKIDGIWTSDLQMRLDTLLQIIAK